GHTTSPTIVDWNEDGVPDLLLGAEDGHFYYLENTWSDEEYVPRRPDPEGDLRALVGRWTFDEGGGERAADTSGYDNYGIIRGAQRVPGYVGSALEFDGFDDYLDLDYTVGAHLDGA